MWNDLIIRDRDIIVQRLLTNNESYYHPCYTVSEIIPALNQLQQYYETTTDDFVTKYCTMHVTFVAIHPLADGNGRYARSHFGIIWNEQKLREQYLDYNNAILRSTWQSFRTHVVDIEPFKAYFLSHRDLYQITT